MKTISVMQPWASLISLSMKRYETRSWYTNYRGPLAIHASKSFPRWAQDLCMEDPFREALKSEWIELLPTGAIIATCRLVRCVSTFSLIGEISEQEMAFGDFTPGRYAWELVDVLPIGPIPAKGSLGLWEWKS